MSAEFGCPTSGRPESSIIAALVSDVDVKRCCCCSFISIAFLSAFFKSSIASFASRNSIRNAANVSSTSASSCEPFMRICEGVYFLPLVSSFFWTGTALTAAMVARCNSSRSAMISSRKSSIVFVDTTIFCCKDATLVSASFTLARRRSISASLFLIFASTDSKSRSFSIRIVSAARSSWLICSKFRIASSLSSSIALTATLAFAIASRDSTSALADRSSAASAVDRAARASNSASSLA